MFFERALIVAYYFFNTEKSVELSMVFYDFTEIIRQSKPNKPLSVLKVGLKDFHLKFSFIIPTAQDLFFHNFKCDRCDCA